MRFRHAIERSLSEMASETSKAWRHSDRISALARRIQAEVPICVVRAFPLIEEGRGVVLIIAYTE